MSDACCGPDEHSTGAAPTTEIEVPVPFWAERHVQLAGLAGVLVLAGYLTQWFTSAAPVAVGLFLAAVVAGGATFVPAAVRRLMRARIGVGTLMTIALVGAITLGQFGEAAMLAFLFSISEALEDWSVSRTRRGLRALLALVPDTVTVLRGQTQAVIAPAELRVGDQMLVRPGERVGSDGEVTEGRSAIDTSAITGESIPVETGPGELVYAGSINGNGPLVVKVTAEVADNSLAKVVAVVEEAQTRKGATARLADRIARPLVPAILVLAVLIAVVGAALGDAATWIERALVVLVAASPCALAISVPVTVIAAVGAASRTGVLIKGGAALEALGAVRAVALDKTGTLTRNAPAVTDVVPAAGTDRATVLAVAAALEARSEHPLAAAVLAAVDRVPPAQDVQTVPGSGITGHVDGQPARLGRPSWITPGPLHDTVLDLQQAGSTVVVVEHGNRPIGLIAVRDDLRPEAVEAVRELRDLGLQVTMLTGDNERTGQALARQAGIDEVRAELRPTDKSTQITQLQAAHRGRVAMVGDGVNDAPALATADVGIAMGAMGSDVAIEAADIALMGNNLRHLPTALRQARRTRRIMLQNVGLSLLIITTLVPLSAFGVLGLATVVLLHEIAEVIVIGNGVRAGRARGRHPAPPAHPAVTAAADPTDRTEPTHSGSPVPLLLSSTRPVTAALPVTSPGAGSAVDDCCADLGSNPTVTGSAAPGIPVAAPGCACCPPAATATVHPERLARP